ncbi:MAG TPA: DUF2461 domain-containing protein, partial [Actinotalea sp.]|nr:DUF2461 domain-containing protein [Actinotalea sp.]
VRFSADKTPYKTHQGARFADCYIQLSADGLAAGAGIWQMAPDQLARYRVAVADEVSGRALERAVAEAESAGYQVLSREELATAPRGYPRDHPRVGLLRRKGLAAWAAWPPEPWLETAAARQRLEDFFDVSRPIRDWLGRVGPSTQERPRR